MLFDWEVAELVRQRAGIKLELTVHTDRIILAEAHGDFCIMHGPYRDPADEASRELNIMVVYSMVRGQGSMQLLVQDCEWDFLNANAHGAEKYDIGPVRV